WCHQLVSIGMVLLFLLAGCGNTSNGSGLVQKTSAKTERLGTGSPFPTHTTTIADDVSIVSFTLNGGVTGAYSIHASLPTSKLRHGHREFTIDVANAGISIFLAFYGYNGPGNYILSEVIDGGDVRIDFNRENGEYTFWDLSLKPKAQCTLTITSDTQSMYAGIDRMRGAFSCPLLPSSKLDHPQQSVAVSNGNIDIAIIVES
ncbi:MAG TPA: hypothetical protein VK667_10660, partial [Ktedonobacteraceae bacterium]|nr:hypothetical protein [Ktedonobacteraceae bacterium]